MHGADASDNKSGKAYLTEHNTIKWYVWLYFQSGEENEDGANAQEQVWKEVLGLHAMLFWLW